MPEHHDPVTLTLSALRTDVERMPLADSHSVRRRGDRRTRNQAVGGALAVVALVAGAAGLSGGFGGSSSADRNIPASGGTSASTQVDQPLTLAAQPLLTAADIGAIGPYTDWTLSPDPEDLKPFNQCVPSPATLGADKAAYGYFFSGLDAIAAEHALRFADTANARAAGDRLIAALAGCDLGAASDNVVASPARPVSVPDADDAQVATREASPPGSEVSHYELGVVRKANVLIVLQWSSMGLPDGVTEIWDAKRLQTALDRAVG